MQVASAVIRPGIARAVIRTEPRGGLAPLEMVLSLPILLFVMATGAFTWTSRFWAAAAPTAATPSR